MKKRILSTLLALCMVLGVLPVSALATDVAMQMKTQTISANSDTSGAITTTGFLYMWGSNRYGTVGNGSNEDQLTPVKVLDDVASVTTFNGRTAAITKDGSLYMWGWNSYDQIGNGADSAQLTRSFPRMAIIFTSLSTGPGTAKIPCIFSIRWTRPICWP